MHKLFKKYFIPHEGNEYKPHLFREAGALVIFCITFVIFVLALSGRMILIRSDLTALVLPKVLVDYANQDRLAANYRALAVNSVLEKAAQMKADDMATKGYFAHKSPDGHTPWYWFQEAGYDFSYAGENLAVNFSDSVDVNQAWMNSPGHRANILNGNFSEIGIATAQGIYQGKPTIFVVQLFGRPAVLESVFVPKTETTIIPKTSTKTNTKVAGIATSSVLSETASSESLSPDGTNELFVAVEKTSAPTKETTNTNQSNFLEKLLTSPSRGMSIAYIILLILIIIGLLFMVFTEIEKQHPRFILLALGLLIVVLGLLYIYQTMLFDPLLIL